MPVCLCECLCVLVCLHCVYDARTIYVCEYVLSLLSPRNTITEDPTCASTSKYDNVRYESISNINKKNDKRLFELYILFRIKLLLSAEIKYDEIEKKSKWDSGYWIEAFFRFFWFNSLILSNENPWVIRIAGVDLLLLTNIYRIWPKFALRNIQWKKNKSGIWTSRRTTNSLVNLPRNTHLYFLSFE